MTASLPDPVPDPPELDPASLSGSEFSRVRKGFEPAEVRSALGRAADALRAWHERDERLVARVEDLERRLAESEELDEQRITTVLGEETARIVAAAREAASEIRTKAEEQAARLLTETQESAEAEAEALTGLATWLRDEAAKARTDAEADAARVREEATSFSDQLREDARTRHDELIAQATSVLDERTTEAEAAAAGIREAAEIELSGARAEGERIREDARTAAAEEVERARGEGREMVAEARGLRQQMLRDLAERRRTARRQIEAARSGRDRIVELLRDAGDGLSSVIDDLGRVDDEAQRSADLAASAVDDDIDAVVAELETGLADGGLEVAVAEAAGVDDAAPGSTVDDEGTTEAGTDAGDSSSGDDATPAEDAASNPPPVTPVVQAAGDSALAAVVAAEPEAVVGEEPVEDAVGAAEGDDDGERSPGATVHDLFERIRAERTAEADIDLTEGETDGEDELDDDAVARAEVDEPTALVVVEETVEVAVVEDEDGVVEVDVVRTGGAEVVQLGSPDAAAEAPAEVSALDRRDELLSGAEKSISRTLKRLVSDEQNEVLDRLRRIKRGRPDLPAILPEGEDVERFVAALAPEFREAAEAGSAFWAERSGSEPSGDLDDDRLVEALTPQVEELLGRRRAHVQRVLEGADAEGLELAELGDHVRAAYREWRTQSVGELAGDLATDGFAQGARAAAGEGTPWCWVPDNGGLPCSDAEDNSLEGSVPCGGAFPTGDVTPPAHSGCRCILVPPPR